MNRYKQHLDTLFRRAQQASAGTRLLSGDDIRNLLADSAPAQPTTTTKGIRPMAITTAATGLVALITAGTLLFTHTPHRPTQSAAPAAQQQEEEARQPKHYSTPGIAGKEKARAGKQSTDKPMSEQTTRSGQSVSATAIVPAEESAGGRMAAPNRQSPAVDIKGIRMLELTDAELLQLGIRHIDESVEVYQRMSASRIYLIGVTPKGATYNPSVEPTPDFPVLPSDHLRMITDDLGNRRIEQYIEDDEQESAPEKDSPARMFLPDYDNMSKSKVVEISGTGSNRKVSERPATAEEIRSFTKDREQQPEIAKKTNESIRTEQWIAIAVNSGKPQDETGTQWRTNYVLWYEPTPEVVAALPERYRTEIERELKLATDVADGSASSGLPQQGFIGLWQTKSGAVTASAVYPNPVADNTLTLSYTLSSPRNVVVTLRSITGAVISQLDSRKRRAGTWTEEYKLGALGRGMYIVSIETDNGEYSVQRLIVE